MNHPYTRPEPKDVCAQCGMDELDHYWKCEDCGMVGNGEYPKEHVCVNKKKTNKS